jgi:predicted ATPase
LKQSLDKALVAKMQDARVLLVLDNLEHLAEPIAPILGWLIATTVNLKLLASSRVDIRVRGRKRYPLAPLPLPIDTEKDLATLAQIESVTLFLDRVRDVLPAFALAPENASVIAAICRRLNGIPLALELAAARTGQLALPDILQQLDHSLELLVDGPLDVPDRQQTMRGALDWSFALLDDVSRKLFVRLGVFHGGASLAAIAATMGDTTNTAQLPVRLQALVEHSLVQLRHDGDGERYVVLEVIRAYAGERLASEGEEDVVQERHLQYFVQLAADAYTQRDGPDQGVWMGRLAQETDNLRAALQWSIAEQRDEAAQLCQFLWPFWYRTSLFDEGLVWIARTLDARANLDAPLRQQCLLGRGQLLRMLGRYDEAEVALRESAELARQSGDLLRLSEALNYLGFLRGERGDFATSLALLDEALVAARQVGDAMQLAYVLHNLGCTAYNSGDLDTAERSLSEAATRCEQLGDTFGLALALENLGLVARARKDYAAAVGYFTRSSAAYAELQDDTAVAHLQLNLGALALITGDHAEALRRLREALAFFQRTNNQQYLIESLEAIAEVWSKTGRQARALWCWAATDAARQAAGLPQTALDQRRFAAAREHTVSELNANEVAEAQRLGQTTSLDDAAATVVQELSQ